LSVILCRIAETNNAEKLLNVIEEVSENIEVSSGIAQYTKIGKVILKGVDALMGFQQTSPLLGLNNNFGQAAGNPFKPGFHAIIHNPNLDKRKFWVKNNKLHYGDSLESALEYRDDDFVLFKIGVSENRTDEETLNFYQEYKEIYNYLANQTEITDKQRQFLKTKMLHLAISIKQSPDLTAAQADRIWKEKCDEINDFVDRITKLSGKEVKKEMPALDQMMDAAMNDLNFL